VTGNAGNTVTLGTGNDAVTFTSGTNTVNATSSSLNAGDNLTGGSDADKLVLSGAGAVDLNAPAGFSGFETVTLSGAGQTLALRNGTNLTVAGGSGNAVTLGTGADNVSFTSGVNTVNATFATLNAGDKLKGGSGHDTLALSGSATFDLASIAALSGFEA